MSQHPVILLDPAWSHSEGAGEPQLWGHLEELLCLCEIVYLVRPF